MNFSKTLPEDGEVAHLAEGMLCHMSGLCLHLVNIYIPWLQKETPILWCLSLYIYMK